MKKVNNSSMLTVMARNGIVLKISRPRGMKEVGSMSMILNLIVLLKFQSNSLILKRK